MRDEAIEFYKKAFGAVEMFRMGEQGKVGHVEMKIGDLVLVHCLRDPKSKIQNPKSKMVSGIGHVNPSSRRRSLVSSCVSSVPQSCARSAASGR